MDKPRYASTAEASRIYFLPCLMTAGNLFCGFAAIMRCVEAKFASRVGQMDMGGDFLSLFPSSPAQLYEQAILFILAGVVFDCLDGRLARLGGKESLFGKEFDSLADIITFGVAPALLVMFLLLSPTADMPLYRLAAWAIGFIYLACSAIRLARFNVITSPLLEPDERLPKTDFLGLPVPAAAGTIVSIVMVVNRVPVLDIPIVMLLLPVFLLVVALLMVSGIHYPSFKKIDWRTAVSPRAFVMMIALMFAIYQFHFFALAGVFIVYLFYGIVRHLWSRHRKDSSDEDNNMCESCE
jgi:CDP-diacylglycerol--serine O-phosphatidyltransferase